MSTQYHVLEYQKMNIHILNKFTVAVLKTKPSDSKRFSIVLFSVYYIQL